MVDAFSPLPPSLLNALVNGGPTIGGPPDVPDTRVSGARPPSAGCNSAPCVPGKLAQAPATAKPASAFDANGMAGTAAGIVLSRMTHLEHGPLKAVNAIVLHQTSSSTAASTLAGYRDPNTVNGAHFLIDKDGTIYQTGSAHKKMFHVGHIQARCMVENTCSPAETKVQQALRSQAGWARAINLHEWSKAYPDRYPYNADSIGIEVVGKATPDGKGGFTYEAPTAAQTAALTRLVTMLKREFGLSDTDVYRHGVIGRKQPSEASLLQIK